ncbi:Thiosulfate:glutathione sulfurtransferase [Chamberlinius hualienensis]
MAQTEGQNLNEIVYSELKDQLKSGLLLIDVRDRSELEKLGKIPSSVNIPLATLKDELQKSDGEFESAFKIKKPKLGDKIVFHCQAGKRGAMAHQIATGLGYSNSWTYKGSFSDWVAQGGVVEH